MVFPETLMIMGMKMKINMMMNMIMEMGMRKTTPQRGVVFLLCPFPFPAPRKKKN